MFDAPDDHCPNSSLGSMPSTPTDAACETNAVYPARDEWLGRDESEEGIVAVLRRRVELMLAGGGQPGVSTSV